MVKILVADDSEFMRKILTNILTKEGYKDIVEAGDGDETITKYKIKKPDLVLLDIIMGKKDGIAVLKEIIKSDAKAKVVMVTAVGQEQMINEAMKAGAKAYIIKPFKSSEVAETVKKILS